MVMMGFIGDLVELPSGKRLHNYGTSPYQLVDHLFLWHCSMAMLNHQRVAVKNTSESEYGGIADVHKIFIVNELMVNDSEVVRRSQCY